MMEAMAGRTGAKGALRLGVILVIFQGLVLAVCCGDEEGARGAARAGQEGSAAVAAESKAEEKAEVRWTPPRFTARAADRDLMVRVIKAYGLEDERVLNAMEAVPRHEFVPGSYKATAYKDGPLPIGYGQTISQPYIVAEMTRQMKLGRESKVLEIGTGSGYQAAVLTEFTPRVYTIEIIEALAESAEERLKRLGYDVVKVRQGDGYYGWEEEAPFDAIIVTAAAGGIPPPLVKQLARGGRMIIPVGGPFSVQMLVLVEKGEDGEVTSRELMAVRFVPLVREGGRGRQGG